MVIYFDGSVRDGRASYSFLAGEIMGTGSVVGPQTSSVAEYQGLIWALRHLTREGIHEAEIRGDSEVVIGQVLGKNRATGIHKELRQTVLELLESLSWSIEKIPRAENKAHINL